MSLSAISFPRNPECTGIQNSPTECQVKMSFNAFWHSSTSWDVMAAWRAFKATWLTEQILTYFPGLAFISISWAQAKIAHILAWKTVVYFPREILCLLPKDFPQTPAQVSPHVLDPSVYQMSPLTMGGVPGPLLHSSLVSMVTLYVGSKLNASLVTSTPILNMGSNPWSPINIL